MITTQVLAILLLVLAVWVGLEVYTQGTDQAFGGLFARFSGRPPAAEPQLSTPKRVGAKVQAELNDAMERRMHDEEDND